MKVALLGFGLIGGSIAYALRRNPEDWTITAWSPTGGGPAVARAEELIDEAADSPARAIQGADLIVIAAPPLAALDLIDALAGPLIVEMAPDALVTDVVSLSVIGPNIYEADRFATAAFAMGQEGIRFIERLEGFEGYMIDRHGQATFTSGFTRYVYNDRAR